MEGAFVILDFPNPDDDPPLVYLDNPSSAAYLQKAADVDRYAAIFEQARQQVIPFEEYPA